MPRVVVVGAGISGLSLAYRLQALCPAGEVLVLDGASRVGGTIDTVRREGFLVEAGPNGFPDTNPSTLDLAGSLGLADQLLHASEAAARNRFLLLNGRLRLLPAGLTSFLGSDLLSWVAKVRLLTERFRPGRRGDGEESVHAFARRRVGDEVARTLVDPFVTGILAGDPKLLSAQAAFPRLAGWEREFGSVLKGLAAARRQRLQQGVAGRAGKLWSFRDGLRTLVEALASRLRTPPLLGVAATSIRRRPGGWRVTAEGHDGWDADAVALTCPAYRQAELLREIDPAITQHLAGIAYNRVVVVGLGYRRDDVPHCLDGFGYLSPQRERRDVLGVQWCSSIYADRAPPGRVLLRAICGGWHRGDVVDWPDDRLVAAVRAELARAVGVRVAPVFIQVTRWPRAIPQYHVGHLARIEAIERRLQGHPGLFVGGNAYRGVAINDCVEQAGRQAAKVADYLRRATDGGSPPPPWSAGSRERRKGAAVQTDLKSWVPGGSSKSSLAQRGRASPGSSSAPGWGAAPTGGGRRRAPGTCWYGLARRGRGNCQIETSPPFWYLTPKGR
ncbi:MAG: protoporphyrinogen oxidase [Gemmataceae bacterium]